MILTTFGSLIVLSFGAVTSLVITEQQVSCPLTQTNAYRNACGVEGWAQVPSTIRELRNVSTQIDCATACNNIEACKSFRYVKDSRKCYLYRKTLAAMQFTNENFESGVFFERECYTKDCDVIASCKSSDACPYLEIQVERYTAFDYENYACGYGVSAKLDRYYAAEYFLNGSYSPCEAIEDCAKLVPDSFTLSYYIPNSTWICTLYGNGSPSNHYYAPLHRDHINEKTLTQKNSSIGASFGYWYSGFYDEYYPPGRTAAS